MLDLHAFRIQLDIQGLYYNPEDKKYKGDMATRVNTKRKKAALKEGERRAVGRPRKNVTPNGDNSEGFVAAAPQVTLAQLNQPTQEANHRMAVWRLEQVYMFHKQNIEAVKHRITCKFCDKYCYTRCKVCGLATHDNPQRGEHVGNDCFTKLHNDHCFGLAITNCKILKADENEQRQKKRFKSHPRDPVCPPICRWTTHFTIVVVEFRGLLCFFIIIKMVWYSC
jgi:hypothetical protein